MGEFIVENVRWKKGESGLQEFHLFESDGKTVRDGTGKTYDFAFWKRGATAVKGTGALTPFDEVNGIHRYSLAGTDTDTIDDYIGEIIEDPAGAKIRSETFQVDVEESSDL